MRPAGKLYVRDSSAKTCLNPPDSAFSNTPPKQIEKFTNTDAGRPEVGKIRQYWKREEDKTDETSSKEITHGLTSRVSLRAEDSVNPPLQSNFLDMKLRDAEKRYRYSLNMQNAPYASRLYLPPVPENYTNVAFGKKTEKSESAGLTVNPPKSSQEVEEEMKTGHQNYVKTHHDYYVGEQINRNYHGNWNKSNNLIFGVETPHCNDGRMTARTLRWPNPESGEIADRFGTTKRGRRMGATKLMSERADAFRARTQPKIGEVHDPIQSTAGMTEAFGLGLKADGCGAGDIIHGRDTKHYLLGKDKHRGVLAAVRQHLKKANYHNFSSLKQAFKHYDKNNDNAIDCHELRQVCFEFNVPIDDDTLGALMLMSSQGTGKINYNQFVNLLNWKDKMPQDSDTATVNEKIVQQIDKSLSNHKTSSSMINAKVGGLPTSSWHAFGVPTVRSDIPAPCIRRVSDNTNYGDELDAHGLLTPSIFTAHGVFESDFFEPRDKATIVRIFTAIGVEMNESNWDAAWKQACEVQAKHYNKTDVITEKACVECFRLVLDRITQDGWRL